MRAATLAVPLLGAALSVCLSASPPQARRGGARPPARSPVTPAFEGWYRNPDGSLTLSFGYFNRSDGHAVEVPLGSDNAIEPSELDGAQPTRFEPGRHWGAFGIRVPADFGPERKVYWTLVVSGVAARVPGHVRREWEIDALEGEAGSGNRPPLLRLDGVSGAGPLGVTAPATLRTRVGEPVPLDVWAADDGRPAESIFGPGRVNEPVRLTWSKHQGPGPVRFSPVTADVPVAGGRARTTASFLVPGPYLLRVRASDASGVVAAGHAQCCWTNGWVRVEVGR